jgi:hypothetical protein
MSATTSKFWELMISQLIEKQETATSLPGKCVTNHKDLSSAKDDNSNSKLLAVVVGLQPANR